MDLLKLPHQLFKRYGYEYGMPGKTRPANRWKQSNKGL